VSEELEILKTVGQRLASAGIAYMATGSIAVNYYTVPRMTRDIDVEVALSLEDTDRLCALFQDDFYIDREAARQAIAGKGTFNIIHKGCVVKVDFIVRKDSEYRLAEFPRRRRVSVEGFDLFITAPEDLIISKLDWARDSRSEIQLTDVRNLLARVKALTPEEFAGWRSQFVTSKADRMGIRHPLMAFTEQGIAMLSSVLHHSALPKGR